MSNGVLSPDEDGISRSIFCDRTSSAYEISQHMYGHGLGGAEADANADFDSSVFRQAYGHRRAAAAHKDMYIQCTKVLHAEGSILCS